MAVVQQKGGVGKTSVATSLYAHAVCAGYSSFIVDLDPQGNSSTWAIGWDGFRAVEQHGGAEAMTLPHGAVARAYSSFIAGNRRGYSSFIPHDEMRPHVRPCTRLGSGNVLPANVHMNVAKVERVHLDWVPAEVVIVDTPPRLPSSVLRELMAHTDVVVAPVQPEAHACQGVPDLLHELAHNGGAQLLEAEAVRLVVNMRQRCANHDVWESLLRDQYGALVSPVVIPRATAWAEVANPNAPWKRTGTVAKVAAALWDDLANVMERRVAA